MNLSKVVTHIKMQLGLAEYGLPFKDSVTGETIPTETVIHEVLKNVTIPLYSQFLPWEREGLAHVSSLNVIDEKYGIYELPRFLTLTPVMWLIKVGLPLHNLRGTYGDVAPAYGINRSVQGTVTAQAYLMIANEMRAEPTAKYLGHNQVQLLGFPKSVLQFILACEHEPNGESLKESCYDSFLELATLDMKVFLYNTLKMYDGIPTAFGQINIKTDDLAGAEEARNTLLNDWRDRSHLSINNIRFM